MKWLNYNCLILLISALWCSFGWAGGCTPNAGTHTYSYDFGVKTVTDPDDNAAGTIYKNAYTWDLSSTYDATCSCSGSYKGVYFTTVTTLAPGHNDGTSQFYKVNDYLEVSTQVYIGGGLNTYVNTPITALYNNDTGKTNCGTTKQFAAGAKGKLSLYIAKPFVGETRISGAMVFSLYGTSASGDSVPAKAMSTVNLSGKVIVPQNCTIQAGQIITIDFGTLYSGDFKAARQKPDNARVRTFSVPIKCTNIDAPSNLTLRLQATADTHYPQSIATDNPDVGVVVTDSQGSILNPNDTTSVIPFATDTSGNANVTLQAYPVSTTGKEPAEGVFTALAYLRVDFA